MGEWNRRQFIGSGMFALGSFLAQPRAFAAARIGENKIQSNHPFYILAKNLSGIYGLDREKLVTLKRAIPQYTDRFGRLTSDLQEALYAIEMEWGPKLDPKTALAFQNLVADVGGKILGAVQMPEEDQSFWLLEKHPLADFRSTPTLPEKADIVVIGAGLTGTSAVHHLLESNSGAKIVLLETGDPCTQASGKNGGNFELMPENFFGTYEGLPKERYKFLKSCYPNTEDSILKKQAIRQARILMQFCERNCKRFLKMIGDNNIGCDFSPKGWLRIANSAVEEQGILAEVAFAKSLGIHYEVWPPEKIRSVLGIPSDFLGRRVANNGNYHPVKFVNEALKLALKKGAKLYTRTSVSKIDLKDSGGVQIETNRGRIQASKVILATNAFSSKLFHELDIIAPYQSQIMNLEHVENTILGMTVTECQGDLYYNFPLSKQYTDLKGIKRGTAHIGGGLDRPVDSVDHLPRSEEVLHQMKSQTDLRFSDTRGQPPSRVWTGPMAFTRDRVPVIGFLHKKGKEIRDVVVAAGFNGYGGSFCMEAGYSASQMALTGKELAAVPADMFSPRRFSTTEPLFI